LIQEWLLAEDEAAAKFHKQRESIPVWKNGKQPCLRKFLKGFCPDLPGKCKYDHKTPEKDSADFTKFETWVAGVRAQE